LKRFIFVILALQVILSGSALAYSIPITNYSFENPSLSQEGNWTQGQGIVGWTVTGYDNNTWAGVIRSPATVSDGLNAAWIQYSTLMYQILSEDLQPNYQYQLSLSIGHRVNFPLDPRIQLLAGNNILINELIAESDKPGAGTYKNFVFTYNSGSSVVPGQALQIKLLNTDAENIFSQPHFDKVILNASPLAAAVPEPASLSLFGLGLLGVLKFRRKRK